MPRFRKSEQELLTRLDKWLYVLKHLEKLQDIPGKLREKIFGKLFNQAEIAKLNPEEMRTYDESLKIYWDHYSIIQTAKHEGREQGRKEGLQQGRQEERIELAWEMKREGRSPDRIVRITGLSKEQIENL